MNEIIWDDTEILSNMQKDIKKMQDELKELKNKVEIIDRDRRHRNWRA